MRESNRRSAAAQTYRARAKRTRSGFMRWLWTHLADTNARLARKHYCHTLGPPEPWSERVARAMGNRPTRRR
jgi:hypothetical protein